MPPTKTMPAGDLQLSPAAVHAKAIELGKHVLRMTTTAGSGHPSSALALAHLVTELMYHRMRWDPADPWNPHNDRLVLSVGHAVPIVYAACADLGAVVGTSRADARPLTINDLSTLRELSSMLEGHPNPAEGFPFFDAATGSLGQGLSAAAGLALAAKLDGLDRKIYVLIGDGESREGQVWEAADFIVDYKLSNVCAIFSSNGHGQAGPVSNRQSPAVLTAKLNAFGFHVVEIDGHDPQQIRAALDEMGQQPRPVAIVARTVKGWGVSLMQAENYHGKCLSASLLDKAISQLDTWAVRLEATPATAPIRPVRPPASSSPGATRRIALPSFEEACQRAGLSAAFTKRTMSTRTAYGVALAAMGDVAPDVISLDADVSNSTIANIFAKAHPQRFIECKIAEQNMISVGVGFAAAGKIPFASSFSKFIARATDQIDMAAITRANLKIVGSHSGVSLGADGPSQMSLADVAYFRSMTRVQTGQGEVACHVFHPSDAVSAFRCCELMANIDGLCFLRTHRPDAPFLYEVDEPFELRGCKQLRRGDRLTLVSSGFMLHTVLAAADKLAEAIIGCNVFDAYTFPLDPKPILQAASGSGRVILTVEDNYIGGLHSELAEAAAESGEIRVVGMTVQRIPKSAKTPDQEFEFVGVGLEQIVDRAKSLLGP